LKWFHHRGTATDQHPQQREQQARSHRSSLHPIPPLLCHCAGTGTESRPCPLPSSVKPPLCISLLGGGTRRPGSPLPRRAPDRFYNLRPRPDLRDDTPDQSRLHLDSAECCPSTLRFDSGSMGVLSAERGIG